MIANIAVIFHWGPDALFPMELDELIGWHDKALERAPGREENR